MLESRSRNRRVAEEQQDKLHRLQAQRDRAEQASLEHPYLLPIFSCDRAEQEFYGASVERVRRSKSVQGAAAQAAVTP